MLLTPIFKKGDRNKPENYCPLALVPTLTEPIESSILKQHISHVTSNNPCNGWKFGYRLKQSPSKAAVKVTDFIL